MTRFYKIANKINISINDNGLRISIFPLPGCVIILVLGKMADRWVERKDNNSLFIFL